MASPVNLQRNELAIKLGGQQYIMRASFEAISGIEADVGSIMHVSDGYKTGEISVTQMVAIIYHGLRGHVGYGAKEPLSKEQIGEIVLERGALPTMFELMNFSALVMNGVSLGKPQPSRKGKRP